MRYTLVLNKISAIKLCYSVINITLLCFSFNLRSLKRKTIKECKRVSSIHAKPKRVNEDEFMNLLHYSAQCCDNLVQVVNIYLKCS